MQRIPPHYAGDTGHPRGGSGCGNFSEKSGFTGRFGSGCAEVRQNPVLFTLQTDVF